MAKILLGENGKPIKLGSGVAVGGEKDWLKKLITNSFSAEDEIDYSNENITSIKNYLFQGCNTLSKLKLPNSLITSISDYAFAQTNNLEGDFIFPNCSSIGIYAFQQSGANKEAKSLDLGTKGVTTCYIGQNAFRQIKLKSLKGRVSIAEQSFSYLGNSSPIEEIDVELIQNVASSFDNTKIIYLNSCRVKVLGNTFIFNSWGSSRSDTNINRFLFDLSEATNTALATSQTFRYIKYSDVYFNDILTTISASNCFAYSNHCNYFFKTKPTVSTNSAFTGMNYNKFFFMYNDVVTVRTMTNWSNLASDIYGWIPEAETTTLPSQTSDGYSLTWYNDVDLTNQITEATIGMPAYAIVGTTQISE